MSVPISTFSVVGYDPETGDLGIAVQSKFLAVGAVVPWAKAGVGAVATQAFANTEYGPEGLTLMADGLSAKQALDRLIKADSGYDVRQVALVDGQGNAAAYTGENCLPWAGDLQGQNCSAQGNILVGSDTVKQMVETFDRVDGDLADRLVEALAAGQKAGGDSRGKQSAALLVVREKAGYGGRNDRYIDIRVDDHPEPIKELGRILGIWRGYFGRMEYEEVVTLDRDISLMCQAALHKAGYYGYTPTGEWDSETAVALGRFAQDHDASFGEDKIGHISGQLFGLLMGVYQGPGK